MAGQNTARQARARMEAARSGRPQHVTSEAPKAEAVKAHGVDIPLLTIVLLLLLFGLVMLFSASYPSGYNYGDSYAFITNQLKYALVGVVGMVAAALFDYRLLRKFAWPLMVVTLALLVVVLFIPDKNDAHRWIWFNSNQSQGFQPSEIAKLALIMVFAKMVSANQSKMRTFTYGYMPFMLMLGVLALLLIMEPHLSCTILVIGIAAAMMFYGGTNLIYLVLTAAAGVAAIWFVLTQAPDLLPAYAQTRIDIWRDIDSVAPSEAYQVLQSLIAVGSGGLFGRGIGGSVQKFVYLPEVHNDFIFAVVCEELGLVGAVVVILLFLALLVRGIWLAVRANDKFGAMLVVGISVQIALQAFLHVAVNLNAIPSTGISLPFFSSGGTSLCMLMGQVGIMLSVSRRAKLRAAQGAEPVRQPESGPAVERPEGGRAREVS